MTATIINFAEHEPTLSRDHGYSVIKNRPADEMAVQIYASGQFLGMVLIRDGIKLVWSDWSDGGQFESLDDAFRVVKAEHLRTEMAALTGKKRR